MTITTQPGVRISKPRLIADNTELFTKIGAQLGFLPDGRMLAAFQGDEEETPTEINVTLNWISELEVRVASGN